MARVLPLPRIWSALRQTSRVRTNTHSPFVVVKSTTPCDPNLLGFIVDPEPSFVVGRVTGGTLEGEKMVGAMPFSSFDAAIKKELLK